MSFITKWADRLFSARHADALVHQSVNPEIDDAGTETGEEAEENGEPEAPDRSVADLDAPTFDVDRYFYAWLIGLDDLVEQPPNAFEQSVLHDFEQMVRGQQSNTHLVPRLPTVIPQLMHSLKDEKMTSAQLARQIAKDPVLVGEVIRLANSPYYRRSRKIASIEQAVVLLGQNGLNQLIARVAFYPILNLRSGQMTQRAGARLWGQSELCALACHDLAEKQKLDAFAAYLSGLVVNVGVMVGLRLMDQMSGKEAHDIPHAWDFYRSLILHAGHFSHRIVAEWGFPENVIQAIGEKAEQGPLESMSPLGRILCRCDQSSKLDLLKENQRLPVAGGTASV